MNLLIPGVGAQGGDAVIAAAAACNPHGTGFIINSSRGIIFSNDPRKAILELHYLIHQGITLELMDRAGAIKTGGHYVYTKGDHGSEYVDKDRFMVNPLHTALIAAMLADSMLDLNVEAITGPVAAGAILGQMVALALSQMTGKVVEFTRADKDGLRGFTLKLPGVVSGKRVAVIEDIFNSGGSARGAVEAVQKAGGQVVCVRGICNRGGVKAEDLGTDNLYSLANVSMEKQKPEDCDLCKRGVEINTDLGHGGTFLAAQQQAAAAQKAAIQA